MSSSKNINAPGGQFGVVGDNAKVEGGIHFTNTTDQRGQTVEGDQYNAGRDINIFHAPAQTTLPSPTMDAQERRNLGILLNKVKSFWIEGVLEKSIHAEVMLELGKTRETEAVEHPWDRVLELPNRESQSAPSGTKISVLFAEMERAMLILGEPGSGKTITLLELARELIEQLEADESFSQPVPVVFNLSSWQKGLPLVDWLESELSTKYQIPKKIGRAWLENHRLLPLLDGLDEVQAENRAVCVETINAFGEEHGLVGLVVCSRLAEYTALPVRLKLNGAIRLQPLTMEQVEAYLAQAGPQLESLRSALQEDEPLQELAESPLMLNVMSLAYQGEAVESGQTSLRTVEARRKHMFGAYIERMFKRKGTREKPYSDEKTLKGLSWLAHGMRQHSQSVFLIEQLQPSWLQNRRGRWQYAIGAWLTLGLTFGTPTAIAASLAFAEAVGLVRGAELGILLGLLGGLGGGLAFLVPARGFVFGLAAGLVAGVAWGVVIGLAFGSVVGLAFGLTTGLAGLIFGLPSGLVASRHKIKAIETLNWSWRQAIVGLAIGLGAGIGGGLFVEMIGLSGGLAIGVFIGTFVGILFGMLRGLKGGEITMAERITPNQGVWQSLYNALQTGIPVGVGIGGVVWLAGLVVGYMPVAGILVGTPADSFALGVIVGLVVALIFGGIACIEHSILRLTLYLEGHTLWNLARFLDHATDLIFLRKVGGGYIFIHRLLLEHFAAMGTAERNEGPDFAEERR